jgi:transposase
MPAPVPESTRARIVALLRSGALSEDIAAETGVSTDTIGRIRKQEAVPRVNRGGVLPMSPEAVEQIRAALLAGEHVDPIRKRLHHSPRVVRAIQNSLGLTPKKRGRPRVVKKISSDTVTDAE